MRIAFVGAPGSGKSTLTTEVFTSLKQQGANAELVDEFVRRDIQRHGPMRSIWEQYRTRAMQKELEDAVPASVDYVVADSGTLTPYFYSVLYCDHSDPRQRLVLQDLYRYLIDDLYLLRYDLIFYLPTDSTVDVEDGTRFQSSEEIATLDAHMDLTFNKLFRTGNTHRIEGSFASRAPKVLDIILRTKGSANGYHR